MPPMEWIGRYRSVVAAMIRYANVSQRLSTERHYHSEYDVTICPQEWQVLEYLLEHPDNTLCMAAIADKLGLVPSTFSKCTRVLINNGLAERFRTPKNQKSVVLRSTEKGRSFYHAEVERFLARAYQSLFDNLSDFTDEQLSAFANALNVHIDSLQPNKIANTTLIKIE